MKSKILGSALLLCFLSACTKKGDGPTDTVRFRLPNDPPTADWTLATDNVSKEVMANIHEGLLTQGYDGSAQPSMAESWTISPDGKTYTFKLRAGLEWSDGKPLTAQHFIDSWERVLNPKTACEYAYFIFDIVGAEDYQKGTLTDFSKVGVKAPDATTLIVQLRKPVAYWIYVPSFWVTFPIRKDIVEKYGDKWTEPGKIVSAGPYVLKVWDHDSKIVIEKNDHYYDKKALDGMIPKVEYRIVKDAATAVALFQNKTIDIVRDLPPVQVPSLSKLPEFVSSPYLRGYYYGFNVKDDRVKDVNVRRALAMSINRDEIVKVVGAALITASKSWIPAPLLAFNKDRGIDFNPEQAKKIWAGIKDKPKVLELWYDQTSEMHKLVAENIQNHWKSTLGIDVQLTAQEWKVYLKTLSTKAPSVWRLGWGADYPDPDTFMNLFVCGSGNNHTNWCNKDYDHLISEAAAGTSPADRAKKYDQAQKIVLEDEVAFVPLFTQTNMHLVSQRIMGFRVNPMGDFYFKNLRFRNDLVPAR